MTTPSNKGLLLAITAFTAMTAGCQTKPAPTTPAATATSSAIALQPYTAPDQSASAGVPSGWQVTSGNQTVIKMTGPQGVTLSLGITAVAHNAPFQANQHLANGVDLLMPYSATLPQKLGMILQQAAAVANQTAPKLTLDSSTPLPFPAALGQCARIVADAADPKGAMKIMAVFCSLPQDSGGDFKNILLYAQAPAAVAAQAAPTAQAIFQSYRIPTPWLQKKLAPFTAAPSAAMSGAAANAATAAIMRSTAAAQAASDNSANCFDLTVLRQTPAYQLPRSCGGNAPD
jgi:hypothetical protein